MKKRLLSILKYSVFLFIGIGLIWWQVSGMTDEEKTQFVTSVKSAKYIYLIPIVIMGLFSHYFRALRWKLLIDPIKPVTRQNSFYATLIGYFGNTFIPRAGEVLRCTVLGKYEKIPFSKLIGTVIVERGFDLICYVFFAFLTVIVQLKTVEGFLAEKTQKIFADNTTMPLWQKGIIFLILAVVIYFLMNFLFKRFGDNKIIKKVKDLFSGLKEGLSTILHLKHKGQFLFHTFMIWLLYLSQIYLGFSAIDVTSHLGLGAAMSILTLSTLAMIISPGGLGAFPVAVQQVLLVYNVNDISFGWMVWGVNTALILLAGGISFLLIVKHNKGLRVMNDE